MDKVKSVKVSYNLSEETKKILDGLKKSARYPNISELVDRLCKFDNNSLTLYIDIVNYMNDNETTEDVKQKYHYMITTNGALVLNLETVTKMKKLKIHEKENIEIDKTIVDNYNAEESQKESKNNEYLTKGEFERFHKAVGFLINKVTKLEKEITELKNK